MLRRTLIAALALVVMMAAGLFAQTAAAADPSLVGHWTFNDASGGEQTGNWSSFGLRGNATISNGQLDVNGTGNGLNTATGWARADGYAGPGIVDKTLIARVALDDLTPSGSPLSLNKWDGYDVFDAIVYGERQAFRWMAGSNFFNRTQDLVPGQADGSIGNMRQVVISYEGLGGGTQRITGCLDGVQLGSYLVGNTATFAASHNPTALFGPRHLAGAGASTVGAINAHIDEAWLYNRAISCGDASAIGPDADGDGVLDASDNCPDDANPGQADQDNDGRGDACDPDVDGDGVANGSDNCADTPNPGQEDSDGDGVGDACETNLPGQMNGGGNFVTNAGQKVSHGFQLNCNASQTPNTLQVNWGGNKFHLETLTSALCGDNPAIANSKNATFDTYTGTGSGRYNGVAGASASWKFVDAGEPGKNDTVKIVIKDAGGNTVLDATATLAGGNHQALHEKI